MRLMWILLSHLLLPPAAAVVEEAGEVVELAYRCRSRAFPFDLFLLNDKS